MKDNFSDVEQRVRRYWYVDGIGELIAGGMFILLGLYFLAVQYFGDQSLWGGILQMSLILVLIGAIYVGRRIINFLKTRLTYPRTGYVEYSTNDKNSMRKRILGAAVAMCVAMGSVIIARRIDVIDSTVAITGVIVAVILLVKQGWSSGMGRFYALSAFSLILGIALSFSGFAKGYNLGLFYGLMGIASAISGGFTLLQYLRENPMPAEDSNGR